MSATTPSEVIDKELEGFREQLARAQTIFERQSQKLADLQFEADQAGIARDRGLYWLLSICEAAEREKWPMSEDAEQSIQHALNYLGDHNIFTGLEEPDLAILRLMEIVAPELEANEEERLAR